MMTKSPRVLILAATACAIGGAAAWFSASPVAAQRTIGGLPTGAAYVDFRVLTADGKPITDLKPEDVKVSVDGRARTVQAMRLVQVSDAAAAAPSLPAPYGTNVVPEGQRNVLVVFNDASILAGQEVGVKAAITRFVSTLAPTDVVGLMTTPRGAVNVEPTTDRARFNAALEKISGRAAPMETADDFNCNTLYVLQEMQGTFQALAGRSAPTYVLFFSAGLAASTTSAARIGASTGTTCELRPDSYQNVGVAAASGRVQTYVLQPEGLSTPRPGDEGLESLAGVTGSRRYHIGSSGQTILDRIAAETSAYYVATVGLEDIERNGQPHRLEVTVARADTTTLHHKEIVLGTPGGRGGRGGRGEAPAPTTPRDMLRTVAPFRDLPLRVGGVASRLDATQTKLKVITMMQPIESVTITAASMALIQGDKIVAQWTAQAEDLSRPLLFAALTADPGKYRLRAAATDSTGRAGAADFDIDVALSDADTVKISGLWTFSNATGQMMPVLEYTNEETAVAYFELYGQPPPNFFARLEVARTLDGPEIGEAPPLQAAPGGPGVFLITGQIPIAKLEPGDYVIRATLGTTPQAKLVRTLRIVR